MVFNDEKVSLHVVFDDHTEPYKQTQKLSTSKDIRAKQNSEILVFELNYIYVERPFCGGYYLLDDI
jgi:hypothetical protein